MNAVIMEDTADISLHKNYKYNPNKTKAFVCREVYMSFSLLLFYIMPTGII